MTETFQEAYHYAVIGRAIDHIAAQSPRQASLEDVAASVDMNIVMNAADEFIEVQGTGEESTFTRSQLDALLEFGRAGIRQLLEAQNRALAEAAVS